MSTRTVSGVFTLAGASLLLLNPSHSPAAPLVRSAVGADNTSAVLLDAVNAFRTDLGGVNNGAGGGPFATGRREITWDGANLDTFAFPNNMPEDFFNRPGPSGTLRGTNYATDGEGFYVSFRDPANNLSNPALKFGDINPQYNQIFKTFSNQRLFAPDGSTITDVRFFVPSDPTTPATVSGFGAIFTDVDNSAFSRIDYYNEIDQLIFSQNVSALDSGLSFLGVSFTAGERISRVRIISGNAELSALNNDGFFDDLGQVDVVALDDFIYGEPQAIPAPLTAGLAGIAGLAAAGRRRR